VFVCVCQKNFPRYHFLLTNCYCIGIVNHRRSSSSSSSISSHTLQSQSQSYSYIVIVIVIVIIVIRHCRNMFVSYLQVIESYLIQLACNAYHQYLVHTVINHDHCIYQVSILLYYYYYYYYLCCYCYYYCHYCYCSVDEHEPWF